MPIRWHDDDPALLREAIQFTSAETGFTARLIEKDYFCSVLLKHLAPAGQDLIFKGGTCLAKVHAGFYRLSEDLDFSISTSAGSTRTSRSRSAAPVKAFVAGIARRLPVFRIEQPLTGSNASTQYNAAVEYTSMVTSHPETIRIEIGLREPCVTEAFSGAAQTVLLDPIRGGPLVAAFPVRCLSYAEAMAEKLRAALSRRDVAIRDFFDIDHTVQNAKLNLLDPELLDLLRLKLAVQGTEPVDVSPDRLMELRRQVEAQLRPVLRAREFDSFDLDRAFDTVAGVARALV